MAEDLDGSIKMNLVRWFRRNRAKLMAIVVVVIMIGFVGGSYLQQLARAKSGQYETVAHFADGEEITNDDIVRARQEVEILRALGTNVLLAPTRAGSRDLHTMLLGELLFSDRQSSSEVAQYMKQLTRSAGYAVSDKQINDIYRRSMQSGMYWLLLKNEAKTAGIAVSNDEAGKILGTVLPQTAGGTYQQVIGGLISEQGVAEKEILAIFGNMMGVLAYAREICLGEYVTARQQSRELSMRAEAMDVEFVKFDSSVFADSLQEPTQREIGEHFEKYKGVFAGVLSEDNPYGFGYKLPNRVKLEYMAIKLDDIEGTVKSPTHEETEKYYQRYREQFVEQIPSDPNDPQSPVTERTKTYAEMASLISEVLLQKKINSKAELILQEARTLTDSEAEDADAEAETPGIEELAEQAKDYKEAANKLSETYGVKIYTGQTGFLGPDEVLSNEYLTRLYLKGYGQQRGRVNIVRLAQIVFAIDELQASELGPFDVPKPKLYKNIGPVRDRLGEVMAVLRITGVERAAEPESINETFSKAGFEFGQDEETEEVYSVKEKVVEDLKKLAAMDTTKNKAEEFVKQIVSDGWEGAIDKFNELYGKRAKIEDVIDVLASSESSETELANPFELQTMVGVQRIPITTIELLAVQNSGDPAVRLIVDSSKKHAAFAEQLYSLLPEDANSLETVPKIMKFEPEMSYYCLKQLGVERLYREEYEQIKAPQIHNEEIVQSQSLAAVFFNPENIAKRMKLRWVKEEEEKKESDSEEAAAKETKGQS